MSSYPVSRVQCIKPAVTGFILNFYAIYLPGTEAEESYEDKLSKSERDKLI